MQLSKLKKIPIFDGVIYVLFKINAFNNKIEQWV